MILHPVLFKEFNPDSMAIFKSTIPSVVQWIDIDFLT